MSMFYQAVFETLEYVLQFQIQCTQTSYASDIELTRREIIIVKVCKIYHELQNIYNSIELWIKNEIWKSSLLV